MSCTKVAIFREFSKIHRRGNQGMPFKRNGSDDDALNCKAVCRANKKFVLLAAPKILPLGKMQASLLLPSLIRIFVLVKYRIMADNDWKARLGMVYSTDPNYRFATQEEPEAELLPPAQQQLRVWLDCKQRAGKVVTLVRGFVGPDDALQELARLLKTRCGVGGTAKAGEIVIQGDHRDRVVEILTEKGYGCKKAGA